MLELLNTIEPEYLLLSGIFLGVVLFWLFTQNHTHFFFTKNASSKIGKKLSVTKLAKQQLPFAILERNGLLSYSNDSFLKLFACNKKKSKLSLLPLLSKADRSWWQEQMSQTNFKESNRVCTPENQAAGAAQQVLLQLTATEEVGKRVLIATDLSSFYRINQHLSDSTELISELSSVAPFGILFEKNGRVISVNKAFCEMFGTSAEQLIGSRWLEQIPQISARSIVKGLKKQKGNSSFTLELELEDNSRRKFWCSLSVYSKHTNNSTNNVRYWYFDDASAQKSSSQRLKQSAVVFESSNDAIMIVDAERKVKMVNSAFCKMTGFDATDIQGRNPQILGAERKDMVFLEKAWTEAEVKGSWQGEVWKRKKDGERYPEWLSITAVKNKAGKTDALVAISSDMTIRKQAENRIRYQANYDPLTDLPNRNLFMDRLKQGINRAKREGTMLSLLFIDLDRFKYINDSFGHTVGDLLLIKVASILKDCVRSSDSIARFGGDEFAIILSPIYGPENASKIANIVLQRLGQAIDLEGYEVVSECSIGISLYPNDGDNEEMLVKNADTAMYKAKEFGRNTYQFFTEAMQKSAQERVLLERELRAAFKNNQFSLAFQPQMDCSDGRVGGMEVLIRWKNGIKGHVSPAIFIALAEDTGLIVPIGTWVLKTACEQYVKWKKMHLAPSYLAVNVSTRQFRTKNFLEVVEQILEETGMLATDLELELTESMLMEDHEFARSLLHDLRSLGIKLSIDDFGTGYSSLSYLKQFPLNNLKIDQSFVKDLDNADNASIVKAIVELGHTLGMQVIAEGVETKQQFKVLENLGVDFIQGYYFSRPMDVKNCEKFLSEKLELTNIVPLKKA